VKRGAVALGVVAVALVAWRVLMQDRPPEPSARTTAATLPPPSTTTATATATATATTTTTATATATSTATATATATTTATAVSVRLDSPKETVETQIALLRADRDAELRATFLPAVRATLTDDDLAFCKQKVRTRPVRPDWEMAEDGVTAEGRPIRRVSMFGKSMTGFVEAAPGEWLADSVWCTQGRLP
jgi:cytoskeletal protein RodZ